MITLDDLFPIDQYWILTDAELEKKESIGDEFYVASVALINLSDRGAVSLILISTCHKIKVLAYPGDTYKCTLYPKHLMTEKELFTYKMSGKTPTTYNTHMEDMIKWWMVYNT